MSSTHLDEIAAVLKRVEAAAYERGKADAKRELLEFLGQKDAQIAAAPKPRREDSTHEAVQQRSADERQRAPKGAVRALVKRVLRENKNGLTPKDFLSHASDEYERMIKPASIRSELRAGKKAGRYMYRDGKWFPGLPGWDRNEEAEATVSGATSASTETTERG